MTKKEAKILSKLIAGLRVSEYEHYFRWNTGPDGERYLRLSDMYTMIHERHGCIIEKATDINLEPQWKGEPLVVYVPFYDEYDIRGLRKLLECMHWIYM